MNVRKNFKPSDFLEIISKMPLLDHLITDISCEDAIREYLMMQRIAHATPKTIKYYQYNLMDFLKLKSCPQLVKEITKHHVMEYLDDKSNRPYAADGRYRAIRAFLNWSKEQNYLLSVPIERSIRPRVPKPEIKMLDIDSFKSIFQKIDKTTFLGRRNRAILLIFFDTGMRLDELTQLMLTDIDIEQGLLRIKYGKGKKERIVHIGDLTRRELWNYLKLHGGKYPNLWLSEERRPVTQAAIILALRKLQKNTGISIHPHLFRHTFAITFLRQGGDLATLQYLLGHEKISTTMLYLKTLNADDAIKAHKKFSPVDRLL